MKKAVFLLSVFLIFSCKSSIKEREISYQDLSLKVIDTVKITGFTIYKLNESKGHFYKTSVLKIKDTLAFIKKTARSNSLLTFIDPSDVRRHIADEYIMCSDTIKSESIIKKKKVFKREYEITPFFMEDFILIEDKFGNKYMSFKCW